jgi:hypothetical protein
MMINPGACSKSRAPDAWPMSPAASKSVFPLAGSARTKLKSPQSETLGYLLVPQRAELGTFLNIAAERIISTTSCLPEDCNETAGEK